MYKLSLFHGIIVDPNNQNRVTVYPDPKTFDLPNCNYYYPDGTLIKVGSNSDHERQFAAKLDLECNLSRFEIKAFLDYHFNNTTSKDEFLNRLEYWVIPELLTGQNETRMAIIKEWLISKKDALIEDFPPRLKALSKPLPTQSPESIVRNPFSVLQWGAIFYYADETKLLPETPTIKERMEQFMAKHQINTTFNNFKTKYYEAKRRINETDDYPIGKLELTIPFLKENYNRTVNFVDSDITLLKEKKQEHEDN